MIVFQKWHIHKSLPENKSQQLAGKTPFVFLFVQKINPQVWTTPKIWGIVRKLCFLRAFRQVNVEHLGVGRVA